jgi:hypothetical protein
MLSNSEQIIFIEAIDQNFESDTEFDIINDESDQNLEEMNAKFCEKLEEKVYEEEDISTENESCNSSFYNKKNNKKNYLMMKDYIKMNQMSKNNINTFISELFNKLKSQVELISEIKAIFKTKDL